MQKNQGVKIMKKSIFKKLASIALALAATVSFAACGGGNNNDSTPGGTSAGGDKKVDITKTQINAFNYEAGYGRAWIDSLAEAFEKAYAGVSFEDGKTGVQVWTKGDMKTFTSAQMRQENYDVYFLENASYYQYLDGALEDLTGIVTATDTKDGKTILSKLYDQQTDYYGVKEDDGTHYYGLPSYFGNYGIVYNRDLFDKEGYYIADDQADGLSLVLKSGAKKSAGPDMKYGTEDDGLPTTYDEFYFLCDEIAANNDVPLCWPGKYYYQHLGNLFDNLVADYEGIEQMRLNYTFTGTAKDLVVLDESGNVVYENGKPVTEEVALTTANGYEVARQEGKLYAMKFIEKIMGNASYYGEDAFAGSITQTDNQALFLRNGTEFSTEEKATAMLIDGPWWQNEAVDTFNYMSKKNANYAANKLNFGWMPLPKATKEKVGKGNVYSDYLNAFVCVKSGLSEGVKKAALEFVKFSCSDEMLVDFTAKSGAVKGYKYDIPSSVTANLSSFSKSLVNYIQSSDILFEYSSSDFYNANIANLTYDVVYSAASGGKTYKTVPAGVHDGKLSGEEYFKNHVKYLKAFSFWK